MNDERIKLGPRLAAIAELVREGITFYDVGSDHAYLPAYLLSTGKIPYAYVSDVAVGPLSKARATLEDNGLCDKASVALSDGLKDVTVFPPCDIAIAGMGGELIARIIDDCSCVRDGGVRLILQPMTRQEELRGYLSENGFEIIKEVTVRENKLYTVIVCEYNGTPYSLSPAELIIGKEGARTEDGSFLAMIEDKLKVLNAVREGRRIGGVDDAELDELICDLEKLLKKGLDKLNDRS